MATSSQWLALNVGECAICAGPAVHRHFGGALSCDSCCAFFRRTVAMSLSYSCKMGKNCELRYDLPKRLCKYCRFRKCLASGMQISAVNSICPERLPSTADTPLKRIMLSRQAIFLNRFRAIGAVYGGQEKIRDVVNRQMDVASGKMSLRAEFIVICKFLKASGIVEHFGGNADDLYYSIGSRFLYTWLLLEQALSTIRNFGHRNEWLFFPDESYAVISEAGLESLYATEPTLTDHQLVSRHGMDYYSEALRVTRKLLNARLDESEIAAITVVLLDMSTRNLPWPGENPIAQLKAATFRTLAQHCQQNYKDFALRLDNIIQLASDFERLRYMYDEHNTLMQLYGKRTVQSEIEEKLKSLGSSSSNDLYSLIAH